MPKKLRNGLGEDHKFDTYCGCMHPQFFIFASLGNSLDPPHAALLYICRYL